ncbi:MAG: transcription termination/antitermination protein NusA [Nitrospirae bacterium]|nr:transcription termination/antitermination protein NusA [Nitrospirota bacterium]
MNGELLAILDSLGREKGIDREVLVEAVEAAVLSAYKKTLEAMPKARVSMDRESGQISVFSKRKAVKEINDPAREILLAEAKKIDATLKEGDECEVEVTPRNFGRIAAQAARQVIMQKIREAERSNIYQEFEEKQGEIITGVVEKFEQGNVIINLGKAEAILPQRERCPGENYRQGERITAYILEVKKISHGPQIILSRTHPALVRKLFELEVPEIAQGTVEIKFVAREPGERSKIAVATSVEKVDSVGSCVGFRGSRVKAVVRELSGERVDIVRWDEDPAIFISNALSPAEIVEIKMDEEKREASLIISNEKLSLAIGKRGQNVRLAARLTGWRINLRGESEVAEERKAAIQGLTQLPGVGEKLAETLIETGFHNVRKIAEAELSELMKVPGIGKRKAEKMQMDAKEVAKQSRKGVADGQD